MEKTTYLFFLLFIIALLSPTVLAEVQTLPGAYKTGNCVTLKQTCSNCTYVNWSLSVPPNQTVVITNQSMAKSSPTLWTAIFCNTTINGEYIYDTFGDENGNIALSSVSFIVNPIGKVLTTAQAGLYLFILLIAILFFVLTLLIGIYLPSGNKRDEMTGYVLAVSNLKYVKMLMICFSYLIFVLISYFAYIISYGYLDLNFLGSMFRFAFLFLVVMIFPLFIVGSYVVIANLIRDSKVGEMLYRGLRVK